VSTGHSYTLASLMLIVTLISVFLGVTVRSPALGTALAFLCVPALVRTIMIRARLKARGLPMSFSDKVREFLWSLFVVAVIATASAGTLFLTGSLVVQLSDASHGAVQPAADVFGLLGLLMAVGLSGFVGLVLIRQLWWPRE
jgi:hypothetical protein